MLHYKANERADTPFWQHCRDMPMPDTLAHKIDLFRSHGRIYREHEELFTESGWLQVMLGQGLMPRGYHPMVDLFPDGELARMIDGTRILLERCVIDDAVARRLHRQELRRREGRDGLTNSAYQRLRLPYAFGTFARKRG